MTSPKYEELQEMYAKYFSLGYLNTDISTKFALISLTCYVTEKIREKKPDVTHYQVLYKILRDVIPSDFIKTIAVICSDFGYRCTEFPTFGIAPKKIPEKIKEIASSYVPF